MLAWMAGRTSDRKMRLFACACSRRFGDEVEERQFIEALEIAERFADGKSTQAGSIETGQTGRPIDTASPSG
jgi:hypothetical protein